MTEAVFSLEVFSALVPLLTVLATAVMAISGAIQAVRFDLDGFGATVLAVATAVGGGTMRDLLIGRSPVFWIEDATYLATAAPVGALAYWFGARLQAGGGRRLRLLMYFDAVGLALFTLVGVRVALAYDVSGVMAVVLGCLTGIGGGILRDILCGIPPSILQRDLYATLSLAGGGGYLLLRDVVPESAALGAGFAAITLSRFWVVARSIRPEGNTG